MRRTLLHCWFISILVASANRVSGLNNEKNDASIEAAKSDEHDIDKRAPMGFQGVRGKKTPSQSYLGAESSYADNVIGPDDGDPFTRTDFDKRAPMMGFQGVRGKKFYPFTDYYMRAYDPFKRAPMGFQGMRGKKDREVLNIGDPFDKRAPASGFHGMRGKKDYEEENPNMQNIDYTLTDNYRNDYLDDLVEKLNREFQEAHNGRMEEIPSVYSNYMEVKRAPSSQFFGMRGKKHPATSSGFFGMRGKKYPYEFRGKFVGVRGKKLLRDGSGTYPSTLDDEIATYGINEVESTKQDRSGSGLDVVDDRNSVPWEKRRAPDGFFGVRGKKNAN